MKKWIGIICFMLLFCLCSCKNGFEIGEKFEGEVNQESGVSISIVEGSVSPTSVDVVILNTNDQYVHGGVPSSIRLQLKKMEIGIGSGPKSHGLKP